MSEMERWPREHEVTEVEWLVAAVNGMAREQDPAGQRVRPPAQRGRPAPAGDDLRPGGDRRPGPLHQLLAEDFVAQATMVEEVEHEARQRVIRSWQPEQSLLSV